jgi:GDPmannose 4,6-dehydratase
MYGKANLSKAKVKLGWAAQYRMKDVVKMMVEAELKSIKK